MTLAETFAAPFVFTGHSLGRNKEENLLADGVSQEKINETYKMGTRIAVEEEIMESARLIITSTNQEIEKQYGLYDNFSKINLFKVIPPGIDLDVFFPYYNNELAPESTGECIKQARAALLQELHRFWTVSQKPFILVLCRPDHRKNISGAIRAYGQDKELQAMANLAIFAGIRKNIQEMGDNERDVLTNMLLLMDQYDLYGKLAIPKKHDFSSEVPELYRLCAESRGVFINPALVEPFGLTLIEASACGVPIVSTNDGGPVDIIANCQNGILIDPSNPKDISTALKSIIVDSSTWQLFSENGINCVSRHYSWDAHCENTVTEFLSLAPDKKVPTEESRIPPPTLSHGERLTGVKKMLITDIDNTLEGDKKSLEELLHLLQENAQKLAWGVATGRSLEMTLDIMADQLIPIPDVLICSVGTEIYYGPNLRIDRGWQRHLSKNWKPGQIRDALGQLEFLELQGPEGQRAYKISYYLEDEQELLARVYQQLDNAKLNCQIIYSHNQFLDILPYRASKGRAIKYLKYKWDISPQDVMVAGDSGNDEDMLRGRSCALVVGNHSSELEELKGKPRIYFSPKKYAAGIIDGLKHYGFL
jgi:sucrose-phosphate synthase